MALGAKLNLKDGMTLAVARTAGDDHDPRTRDEWRRSPQGRW